MSYEHKVIFLPAYTPRLCAEMDKLSTEGWELVAWLTGWLSTIPSSRQALIRRSKSETGAKHE